MLSFLSHTSLAEKGFFYFPPVLKVELEKTEWNVRYDLPNAVVAPSWKEEGFVKIKFLPQPTELLVKTFYFGKSDTKSLEYFYKNHQVQQEDFPKRNWSRCKRINSKMTEYVYNYENKFAIIVSASYENLKDTPDMTILEDFIRNSEIIALEEMDKVCGYPMETPNDLSSTIAHRKKIIGNGSITSLTANDNFFIMDYLVGFTFKDFTNAYTKYLNDEIDNETKWCYVLKVGAERQGLIMVDSMLIAKTSKKLSDQFLREIPKAVMQRDIGTAKLRKFLKATSAGAWWFLMDDTHYDFCFVSTTESNQLQFRHHRVENTFYSARKEYYEKADFMTEYGRNAEFNFFGPEENVLMFQWPKMRPTPHGLFIEGLQTVFLDTAHPDASPIIFTNEDLVTDKKVIHIDAGMYKEFTAPFDKEDEKVLNLSNFDSYFYYDEMREWKLVFDYWLRDDDEKRDNLRDKLNAIPASQTLIYSRIIVDQTAVSNSTRLIRPILQNGQVIRSEILEISKEGIKKFPSDRSIQELLVKNEYTSTLKSESLKSFIPFYRLEKKTERKIRINERVKERISNLKNYSSEKPIYIVDQYGRPCRNVRMDSLIAVLNQQYTYPTEARNQGIVASITVLIKVDDQGKVIDRNILYPSKSTVILEKEAMRLAQKIFQIPVGRRDLPISPYNREYQLSILFLP
jgi:TonB family protein